MYGDSIACLSRRALPYAQCDYDEVRAYSIAQHSTAAQMPMSSIRFVRLPLIYASFAADWLSQHLNMAAGQCCWLPSSGKVFKQYGAPNAPYYLKTVLYGNDSACSDTKLNCCHVPSAASMYTENSLGLKHTAFSIYYCLLLLLLL